MKNILFLFLLFQTGFLYAQDKTQTIRGQVKVFTTVIAFQDDF